MSRLEIVPERQVRYLRVGNEQTPIIVIDNFFPEPQVLVELANQQGVSAYQEQVNDWRPRQ